ncbi:Hypothetical_protein [Hexamita inflata]|uniref:Hypothetical_protein n=1 Tax=Hexamita inflata TaxID=28002 RepID=A0ABP1I0F8_9EUKA
MSITSMHITNEALEISQISLQSSQFDKYGKQNGRHAKIKNLKHKSIETCSNNTHINLFTQIGEKCKWSPNNLVKQRIQLNIHKENDKSTFQCLETQILTIVEEQQNQCEDDSY